MKVIRETCVAGNVIDVTIKVTSGLHSSIRKPKMNITSEKVQRNNDRQAAKKLARIINANFDKNSWHDTLTYKNAPSTEEAKAELKRFIDRAAYAMKKAHKEFKWVVTTEYVGKRIHHHFITNAPLDIIRSKWGNGKVLPRPFDDQKNYYKLAEYIIKETAGSFRESDSPFGLRYSHSRNLVIPEVKVEVVSEANLSNDPKPLKGYYIDQDTVRRYEHPITGLEHIEYMMIAIDEEPRIKKYYRGKRKTREENYKRYINEINEQQSLFS